MNATPDLARLNAELESKPPHDIITWAVKTFWPDIAMSSSFQTQSLPLLHIVSQVAPQLPILFLDTGYHFPETLAFRDQLVLEWKFNLQTVRAVMPRDEFVRQHGDDLYRKDPDLCCYINKVEPMERAMKGLRAWISGIRRDQSATRTDIQVLERTPDGVLRIHPLATWTRKDVWQYVHDHHLPEHPLLSQGYLSIGCAPCTRHVQEGEDERAGRWAGQEKTECGLHTLLRTGTDTPTDYQAATPAQEPTAITGESHRG